jgi:hypothetical protein
MAERDVVQFERISVCAFDTKTHKIARLGLVALGSLADICVGEDGVLSLCATKGRVGFWSLKLL